jgi:Kef-type K+ transport system membrane component KefB
VAGATLQPGLIPAAGFTVIVYIVIRIFSKLTGVYTSTKVMGMEQSVCQNMPYCLLSQAGTTIGLTMLVAQQLPEVSDQILTVMLSAVIFFEIIAPPLTRNALVKLGEARRQPQ